MFVVRFPRNSTANGGLIMCELAQIGDGFADYRTLNAILQKRSLKAEVIDCAKQNVEMLVDYASIVEGKIFLVLLEKHGHRAHLFIQSTPGDSWAFQQVFKFPFGNTIQGSLGPHTLIIVCDELKKLLT